MFTEQTLLKAKIDLYNKEGYKGGRWYYKEQIEKLGLED